MTINDIFKKKGENFFRLEEEKEVLRTLNKNNCVIALGGGAFINKIIRENILEKAISVWLDVDLSILNKRVKWNEKRPLLKKENNQKILEKLYAERKNYYKLANHKITCGNLNKKDIAEKIAELHGKY